MTCYLVTPLHDDPDDVWPASDEVEIEIEIEPKAAETDGWHDWDVGWV